MNAAGLAFGGAALKAAAPATRSCNVAEEIEKLARDDGTLNDKDLSYPWAGLCSGDGVTLCGRDADCSVAGGTCDNGDGQTASPGGITIFEWVDQLNAGNHAGYNDWRVPNCRELESLVNLEQVSPPVSAAFNTDCGANSSGNPGCTVTTCSCTVPSI